MHACVHALVRVCVRACVCVSICVSAAAAAHTGGLPHRNLAYCLACTVVEKMLVGQKEGMSVFAWTAGPEEIQKGSFLALSWL